MNNNGKDTSLVDYDVSDLSELIDNALDDPRQFYLKIEELLSPQERVAIRKGLKNKGCLNCTNPSCRANVWEKAGLDSFENPQGNSCIGWSNRELVGRCKVLQDYDINKIKKIY